MDVTKPLLIAGVSFGQNLIGLVTRPYETYRRIVDHGTKWELWYMVIFLAFYFAIASIVKTAAFRPFLLTQQFIVLFVSALAGSVVAVFALLLGVRLVGVRGDAWKVARAWSYTLIPTTLWFLVTSILYVLLPPPRTESVLGIVFSITFLSFSATMFWWKATLVYLALRFSTKLDLAKICIVLGFAAPILTLWSYVLYRIGIFRVPFI